MLFRETSKTLLCVLVLLLLPSFGHAICTSAHQTGSVVGSMLFIDESEKTALGVAAKVVVELEHEGQILTIVSDDNGDFLVKLRKGIYRLKSARNADNTALRFSTSHHRSFTVKPNHDTRFDIMLLMR
jgi:hypothetical protein